MVCCIQIEWYMVCCIHIEWYMVSKSETNVESASNNQHATIFKNNSKKLSLKMNVLPSWKSMTFCPLGNRWHVQEAVVGTSLLPLEKFSANAHGCLGQFVVVRNSMLSNSLAKNINHLCCFSIRSLRQQIHNLWLGKKTIRIGRFDHPTTTSWYLVYDLPDYFESHTAAWKVTGETHF